MTDAPYFAYGSNLWLPRIRHRVPSVEVLGPARLRGWSLRWHKRGSDGSGKCDVVMTGEARPGGQDVVHGALYRIPPAELELLDRVEALGVGYDRASVTVRVGEGVGEAVTAWTYVGRWEMVDPELRPFGWYRDFVLRGAESIGAPASYLGAIRRVDAVSDPDAGRVARERALLETPG